MKDTPKIGTLGQQEFRVKKQHGIGFADDELPAVLSTPTLIGFLEQTARETIAHFLEPDEASLGIIVEIEHLAPTPIGSTVTCTARVVFVEGNIVSFQVEARDETERIARGLHKRSVLAKSRFARRVAQKSRK